MKINVYGPVDGFILNPSFSPDFLVGTPILKDGKVVGYIESINTDTRTFQGTIEEDIELVTDTPVMVSMKCDESED